MYTYILICVHIIYTFQDSKFYFAFYVILEVSLSEMRNFKPHFVREYTLELGTNSDRNDVKILVVI